MGEGGEVGGACELLGQRGAPVLRSNEPSGLPSTSRSTERFIKNVREMTPTNI